jgi:hypothetical protein
LVSGTVTVLDIQLPQTGGVLLLFPNFLRLAGSSFSFLIDRPRAACVRLCVPSTGLLHRPPIFDKACPNWNSAGGYKLCSIAPASVCRSSYWTYLNSTQRARQASNIHIHAGGGVRRAQLWKDKYYYNGWLVSA